MKEFMRAVKIDVIVTSVVCIVMGVVLILFPTQVVTVACQAVGVILAILGGVRLVSTLLSKVVYLQRFEFRTDIGIRTPQASQVRQKYILALYLYISVTFNVYIYIWHGVSFLSGISSLSKPGILLAARHLLMQKQRNSHGRFMLSCETPTRNKTGIRIAFPPPW